MKILYVASNMEHIRRFHLPYIDALRSEGNEVTVLASGKGADLDLPFDKKIFSAKNAACRRRVKKLLREETFDAVVLNTTLAAFLFRLALPKKDRPRVVNFVHGYFFREGARSPKERLYRLAERLLAKKTDAILTMNDEDERLALADRLDTDVMRTRGMGAIFRAPTADRETARKNLGVSDAFVLTFVGELSGRKNQAALIDALADVRKKAPSALLLLVGDGKAREALEKRAAKRGVSDAVRFLGRRSDIPDLLAATDLYVSASKCEGLPFNIVEAMAAGLPILASRVKGHVDLLSSFDGALYGEDAGLAPAILAHIDGKFPVDAEGERELAAYYSFEKVYRDTLEKIKKGVGV